MKERDKAYITAKRSNSYSDFQKFRLLRNSISNKLSTAKNSYFASKLKSAPDLKSKWYELRKLGVVSSKKPSPLKYFTPETLNTHYANVARKSPALTSADVSSILSHIPVSNSEQIFNFSEVTCADVAQAIMSGTSKSVGVDSISTKMMRSALPSILQPLCNVFNASLQNGVFPESWKATLVMPLLKKASPESPSDTRPIANLSEVSKVLERIVHKQIVAFFEKHNLFDPGQSGFRSGRSTQSALLEVLEFARASIDKRKLTLLVLFDFEKAFDSIPHSILLAKLRKYNCSDTVIKWFADYLSSRKQAVSKGDDTHSAWLETFTGVPQGSVLGPLLFLIFINDLHEVLAHSKHTLFADDLQIYLECYPEDLESGLARVKAEIAAIMNWANLNGIRLNLSKTKIMAIGSNPYIHKLNLLDLQALNVNDYIIPFVSEAKNLGLLMTSTLSWEPYINAVINKFYRIIFSLRHAKHALSFSMRKYLVETLIFPHFDYVSAALSDLDSTQNLRLERALNACVRFVYGHIRTRDHVTPFRLALGWLSIKRRREYFMATQAYVLLAQGTNKRLISRFIRLNENTSIRRGSRRVQHCLIPPYARLEAFRRSFTVASSHLLNNFEVGDFQLSKVASMKTSFFSNLLKLDKDAWVKRASDENIDMTLYPPMK